MTRVATSAVPIAGLPSSLDAYPVYQIRVKDGAEQSATLLRLHIRAVSAARAATWPAALAAMDDATTRWLFKHGAGKAKRLRDRFGDQTLDLLYRWSSAGVVVFEVDPPAQPGGPHGSVYAWRLSDAVKAHADELTQRARQQQTLLQDQARELAEQLRSWPALQLLSQTLIEAPDAAFAEHAITAAESLIDDLRQKPRIEQVASAGDAPAAEDMILQRLGRGQMRDYLVEREPIARGGQAVVSVATHKATRHRVAYKRVRVRDADARARMRREIDFGRLFGDHPHVMPILDADPDGFWFVMPLANGTASQHAPKLQHVDQLKTMVISVCEGLREPHRQGLVHRDLKPDNLLLLHGRWTVADWGLGRRPRGETTEPERTRTGSGYGTVGFAAPELSVDAHDVGPSADIYSIGQIIGAILTAKTPQANIPLLPATGPWISIVEHTTRYHPAARPQSVDELLDAVNAVG
ncbi:serine/threonine protein kinase [Actinoplanes sp. TBRC 11911]|uniref:serine/threonine-protein kinase n=1 Tax=Actinoplanes sp. TBRC 11911 TaxID=2729386 RepID=UPI00145EE385|nr:serine/threonine-protein kinase [Actinoplanes sp. TBRC 11911]NMO53431.1 serine/threonine protein kinase [Actinoplanes sp. TBRC 11911]